MTVAPERHVVVVDGSNLATEGRTTPSLRQLDEAVRAYAAEDPDAEIVVVVDASFEHRIDPSERKQLIDAELHGEVVSPPAGAIGRGDAFVLRIAERTGASVLSNDSFQEFHGEHPWLFDKGRLVGGKPVPGVGWIFTPRIPVRGPKSRQAQGKGKGEEAQALSPPVKAAELAKAAKKMAARRPPVLPDGSVPKVGDVWPEGAPLAAGTPGMAVKKAKKAKKAEPAVAAKKTLPARSAAKKDVPEKAPTQEPAKKPASKRAAAKKDVPDKEAPASVAAATKGAGRKDGAGKDDAGKKAGAKKLAAKKVIAKKEAGEEVAAKKEAAKKVAAKKEAGKEAGKKAAATKEASSKAATHKAVAGKARAKPAAKATPKAAPKGPMAVPVATAAASKAKAARSTAAKNPAVREAIGQALAEAILPAVEPTDDARGGRGDKKGAKRKGKDERPRRRRSGSPPPAVNEPLAFITFVATYPLEQELEGEVVSFTSHGAMVDVDLPGGGVLHSYIPLAAMGDPPPTKARQVLKRGERRRFVLVALDPPRRVAELSLPEIAAKQGVARR